MVEIIFSQEKLKDIFNEIHPLLIKHKEEIAHYQDIKLNPDMDRYERLEASNILKVYVARQSGEIVGYAAYFIMPSLHYKDSLQAAQDVLYIKPENRRFGLSFIKWCDEQLNNQGVQVVYHHFKAKNNPEKLMQRLGYELIDLIYGRRLDGKH